MDDEFSRLDALIGQESRKALQKKSVAIFGLGGVGSAAAEAVARHFVGKICLVDGDAVQKSNINRQIVALNSNLGKPKADAMAQRILDINPACKVAAHKFFFNAETAQALDFLQFDFVIDAIDSVCEKILLIETAKKNGVPIASAMGTAAKFHPEFLRIADIYQTFGCPLARIVRAELRRRNIDFLDTVFSPEPSVPRNGEFLPSSALVPPAAGIMLASIAIRTLISGKNVSSSTKRE